MLYGRIGGYNMLVKKCDFCGEEMSKKGKSLNFVQQDHNYHVHGAYTFGLSGKRKIPTFEVLVDSHHEAYPTKYVFCSPKCLKGATDKWTT